HVFSKLRRASRRQVHDLWCGAGKRDCGSLRMSREWLEQRERGSIIGIRLIVGLALLVGRPTARLALYPVCLYFLLFSIKPRAGSRKYLALVLKRPPSLADLFRHYFTFAAVALDRFFLLKDRYELFETRIHGEEE